MDVITHIGIPCIGIFVNGETHIVFAGSAKLVFSVDSNLGDGVLAVAMQEITGEGGSGASDGP